MTNPVKYSKPPPFQKKGTQYRAPHPADLSFIPKLLKGFLHRYTDPEVLARLLNTTE